MLCAFTAERGTSPSCLTHLAWKIGTTRALNNQRPACTQTAILITNHCTKQSVEKLSRRPWLSDHTLPTHKGEDNVTSTKSERLSDHTRVAYKSLPAG